MPTETLATQLRRPARAAGFVGVTTVMLAAYHAHARLLPRARRGPLLDRYKRAWLDALLGIFRVEYAVAPAPPPPPAAGARLVVANHRSAMDIALLLRLFGGHFLSRGDLARWPLVGAVARTGGTIFVDRGEGMSRAAAVRVIRRRLQEGGTVLVFPEGTTYAGDEVRPFHRGAFVAAKGLDVEVVPVGLAYEPGAEYREPTFLSHLRATAGRPTTRLVASIGPPRPLGGDVGPAAAEAYRAEVQDLVRRARAQLDASPATR